MRINKSDLEAAVLQLNTLTNSPTTYMTDGVSNIGHYHLSWAYGGVRLHRLTTHGGAIITVCDGGYGTKRELYEKMQAYISGTNYANNLEKPQ